MNSKEAKEIASKARQSMVERESASKILSEIDQLVFEAAKTGSFHVESFLPDSIVQDILKELKERGFRLEITNAPSDSGGSITLLMSSERFPYNIFGILRRVYISWE